MGEKFSPKLAWWDTPQIFGVVFSSLLHCRIMLRSSWRELANVAELRLNVDELCYCTHFCFSGMCEHLGWTTQNMELMESFLYLQRKHFGKTRIYRLASTTVILPLSILLTWTGSMMKRSVRNSLILIIARMILFPPPLCLPAWHFGMEWYWEILWVHRLA